MTFLKREEDRFTLGWLKVEESVRGDSQGVPARVAFLAAYQCVQSALQSEPSESPATVRRVSVAAKNRAELMGAWVAIWQCQAEAWLLPNRRLLDPTEAIEGAPLETLHLETLHLEASAAMSGSAHGQELAPKQLSLEYHVPFAALLTSGSTGEPTAHHKSAGQLLEETLALGEMLALDSKDVVLATASAHHLYGLLFGALLPWAVGAAIVADDDNESDAFHPEKLSSLIARSGATILVTVPAHLRALLAADIELSPLRRVVCSAAPLSPQDAIAFEQKFGVEVIDVLGSTETGGIATRRASKDATWLPLPGVQVTSPAEEELTISSPWADDAHRRSLVQERGRLLSHGRFEYLGRGDGVIKVGGKRLNLREIEVAALEIEGVRDAFSLAREVSSLRGKEICLLVESDSLTRMQIRSILRKRLDPVFVPRKIRVLPRLPRDDRGKLPRKVADALFSAPAGPAPH